MPRNEYLAYRQQLRAWAEDLTKSTTVMPVMLREICNSLDISVQFDPMARWNSAYLKFDKECGEKPYIILPAKTEINGYDRFLIAHEIGHYFLTREYDEITKSKSRYWDLEDVCNEFARNLLIPTKFLDSFFGNDDGTATGQISICDEIASRCAVVWMQAAKRITYKKQDMIFLRLTEQRPDLFKHNQNGNNKSNEASNFYFRVKAVSLERNIGIGTKVRNTADEYDDIPLFCELSELLNGAREERKRMVADISEAVSVSCLKKFLPHKIKSAAARLSSGEFRDVKIAIRLDVSG